eukprot:3038554-Alexandrium_andersonii.AAC.1
MCIRDRQARAQHSRSLAQSSLSSPGRMLPGSWLRMPSPTHAARKLPGVVPCLHLKLGKCLAGVWRKLLAE